MAPETPATSNKPNASPTATTTKTTTSAGPPSTCNSLTNIQPHSGNTTDVHMDGDVTTGGRHFSANQTSTLQQLVRGGNGTTHVEDLDALEDLEISPKPTETLNSSQAAVLQQLQQIRRTPLTATSHDQQQQQQRPPHAQRSPTRDQSSSPASATANKETVVTSVSQYEITQSNELVSEYEL